MVSEIGSVRTGASSKVSRSSKSTAKSAKNRRKNERKKFSTRFGSPHEQLGLLEEARLEICLKKNMLRKFKKNSSYKMLIFDIDHKTHLERPWQILRKKWRIWMNYLSHWVV